MTRFLDWVDIVLIGWLVVSAIATPLVSRFLSHASSGAFARFPPAPEPLKMPRETSPAP